MTSRHPPATHARVARYGEGAWLVTLGDSPSVVSARRAQALARAIQAEHGRTGASVRPPVAGIASVLVPFDPLEDEADAIRAHLEALAGALAADPGPDPTASEHEIRVRYGGDDGPDLDGLAALTGLAVDELIDRHAAVVYEVLALGFAPGFAYLGELDTAIRVPRLDTPRSRVPAGSVAIADAYTGIYPSALPGGWRLIGRTDASLFDPLRPEPALLRPGDRVRFVPLG